MTSVDYRSTGLSDHAPEFLKQHLPARDPAAPEPAVATGAGNQGLRQAADPDPAAEPAVSVRVDNAIRTSAGAGPGTFSLPEAEAARLLQAGLAIRATAPPGFGDVVPSDPKLAAGA